MSYDIRLVEDQYDLACPGCGASPEHLKFVTFYPAGKVMVCTNSLCEWAGSIYPDRSMTFEQRQRVSQALRDREQEQP